VPGSLSLAVAQVGGIQPGEERAAVVDRLVGLLEEAAARSAQLVVFPELTLTTFFPRYWDEDLAAADRYYETAMPNPVVQPLFDRARELRVGFYLGYAELTPDGHRYNTSILVDREGVIAGKYRKIHLPGHATPVPDSSYQHLEKYYFEVGDLGFGVFEVDGVRIGMCLCNDRRWPEVYRVLALQGADLVLLGYNTPLGLPGWQPEPHHAMSAHLLSLRAGAYQNSLWVAAAAKCGVEDGVEMIGGSAIVAPTGDVVAQADGVGDQVVQTTIDLDAAEPYRREMFNFAAHRRPEHYGLIVERVGRGDPLPSPAQDGS
jgi:predicted amidohydrolase